MKRKKGYFSISAVSKMFSVHQQTIRMYEKEGLITPQRSSGNTRMFSEEDINRLEEIIYLTHKLGINLAGVEMILKLQKKISKLQEEVNKLFGDVQENLEQENINIKKQIKEQVKDLVQIKKKGAFQTIDIEEEKGLDKTEKPNSKPTEIEDDEDWDIDYEK